MATNIENPSWSQLNPNVADELERILEDFEAAWCNSVPPDISTFIARTDAGHATVLLRELLRVDVEYRQFRFGRVEWNEYLKLGLPTAVVEEERQRFLNHQSNDEIDGLASIASQHIPANMIEQRMKQLDAAPFSVLNRYEIVEELGVGGFGAVYKARDIQLDRLVALKVPRQRGPILDRAQFLQEARAAAKLRHPNIVPVFETVTEKDAIVISFAFIDGRTLRQIMRDKAPSVREIVAMITKLARALHYAHSQGLMHRDVKPENVILDDRNEPHILDFGLASAVSEQQSFGLAGTPGYMSPEQAGQASSITPAADQYSLGIVLFEFCVGRRPFCGPLQEVVAATVKEHVPNMRQLNASVPAEVAAICQKATSLKPGNRYASCSDLADDLRRWLDGYPILAIENDPATVISKWLGRNPLASRLFAVLCLALICIGIVAFYATSQKRRVDAQRTRLASSKLATQHALADARFQVAKNLGSRGRWDHALQEIDTAISLKPSDPWEMKVWRVKALHSCSHKNMRLEIDRQISELVDDSVPAKYRAQGLLWHGDAQLYADNSNARRTIQLSQNLGLPAAESEYAQAIAAPDVNTLLAHARRAREIDPYDLRFARLVLIATALIGDWEAAIEEADTIDLVFPNEHSQDVIRVIYPLMSGNSQEADAAADNLREKDLRTAMKTIVQSVGPLIEDSRLNRQSSTPKIFFALMKLIPLFNAQTNSSSTQLALGPPALIEGYRKLLPVGVTLEANPLSLIRFIAAWVKDPGSLKRLEEACKIHPDGMFSLQKGKILMHRFGKPVAAKQALEEALGRRFLMPFLRREAAFEYVNVMGFFYHKNGNVEELRAALPPIREAMEIGNVSHGQATAFCEVARICGEHELARQIAHDQATHGEYKTTWKFHEARFCLATGRPMTAIELAREVKAECDPKKQADQVRAADYVEQQALVKLQEFIDKTPQSR